MCSIWANFSRFSSDFTAIPELSIFTILGPFRPVFKVFLSQLKPNHPEMPDLQNLHFEPISPLSPHFFTSSFRICYLAQILDVEPLFHLIFHAQPSNHPRFLGPPRIQINGPFGQLCAIFSHRNHPLQPQPTLIAQEGPGGYQRQI